MLHPQLREMLTMHVESYTASLVRLGLPAESLEQDVWQQGQTRGQAAHITSSSPSGYALTGNVFTGDAWYASKPTRPLGDPLVFPQLSGETEQPTNLTRTCQHEAPGS